jgi:hypothetical protein
MEESTNSTVFVTDEEYTPKIEESAESERIISICF